MKITINGSAKELTKLAIALSCMENEEKKPCLPPLLTEIAENEIPKERTFSDFKPRFQATLDKFCANNKSDISSEAIQNVDKENAPQAETAESVLPFIPIF